MPRSGELSWLHENRVNQILADLFDEVLWLAIGSQGNVRTTTLKAFSEAEAAKIIEKLP